MTLLDSCPVCGSKQTSKLPSHFYHYLRCGACLHFFRSIKEAECDDEFAKIAARIKEDNPAKVVLAASLPKGCRVLDLCCNEAETATAMQKMGLDLAPLHPSKARFPVLKKRLSAMTERNCFDAVLAFHWIEYAYCPYSEIIELCSFLRKGGVIKGKIPVGNDPTQNPLARAHEFSTKSFEIFVSAIGAESMGDGGFSLLLS
jgi:hypothetical protein